MSNRLAQSKLFLRQYRLYPKYRLWTKEAWSHRLHQIWRWRPTRGILPTLICKALVGMITVPRRLQQWSFRIRHSSLKKVQSSYQVWRADTLPRVYRHSFSSTTTHSSTAKCRSATSASVMRAGYPRSLPRNPSLRRKRPRPKLVNSPYTLRTLHSTTSMTPEEYFIAVSTL